ncbi:hypothetical protein DMJ13_26295 [halophilic archaeon]|nr:hypothetical protein DMJ13_26295 [halophilic archaeon]
MMVSTSTDIPDDATYEEALEVVEERLYNGARVTGEWMGLKKVAQLRDEDRDRNIVSDAQSSHGDVIEDLKDRNPGVPPWAFRPQTEDPKKWTGIRASWAKNTEFDPDDWDDRGQLITKPE